MNKWQKVILVAGIAVIVLMVLFPPWMSRKHKENGYALITHVSGSIDKQRLGIQIGVVALVTTGLIVTLGFRKPYKRIIIAGCWFLGLSLLSGIALSWYELRDVSLHPNEPGFIARSTIVPLFQISSSIYTTIPVFLVSAVLLLISAKKQKLWWLSIIAFILLGLYWLFWVLLASRMPLD